MIVQIILWLNACRKRESEKTTEKFFIPTNTGVPIPSHLKKAKISVQIDGTKITNTFIAKAGPIKGRTASIFFAHLFIDNKGGEGMGGRECAPLLFHLRSGIGGTVPASMSFLKASPHFFIYSSAVICPSHTCSIPS